MNQQKCDYGVMQYVKKTLEDCTQGMTVFLTKKQDGPLPSCVVEMEAIMDYGAPQNQTKTTSDKEEKMTCLEPTSHERGAGKWIYEGTPQSANRDFKGVMAKVKFSVRWIGAMNKKASLIGVITHASHAVARGVMNQQTMGATFRCVGKIIGKTDKDVSEGKEAWQREGRGGSEEKGGTYTCQHFFEALVFSR